MRNLPAFALLVGMLSCVSKADNTTAYLTSKGYTFVVCNDTVCSADGIAFRCDDGGRGRQGCSTTNVVCERIDVEKP